jgi:acetyl-CoA/propionyl-CoA carboxylase biotin carboxyl carrier protein
MLRALGEFEVAGIATTIPAHIALLSQPDFAAVAHSTKWVEEELDATVFTASAPSDAVGEVGVGVGVGTDLDADELVERTVPVEVNGKRFEVRVWLPEAPTATAGASSRARPSRPRPGMAGGASAAGNGTVSAPMQGTIVKVLVSRGDAVDAGQALLVLEAMKMENHINAETAGTVAEIRVAEGDTVGTGDVLVVIE